MIMNKPVVEIADLKRLAKRRVPRMFYDYVDSGSWTESTYRSNETEFSSIKLRQRVAQDMTNRSLSCNMIDRSSAMPVALAPTGLTGMLHPDGEILAAQAAEEFGVPFTLSTMSICSLESVAEKTSSPLWLQLYVMRDRVFIDNLINRAKTAGVSVLMLTLDLQIMGQRHNDLRNGLSAPPKKNLDTFLQLATRPRWCFDMLRTPNRQFGNIVGHVSGVDDMSSLVSWTANQFDPKLAWSDIAHLKERWGGPLILKGIMDVEDARLAVQSGADAIIVSNHGGRQLDGAPATIDVLPEIVAAVGNDIEVHIDGGLYTGQSIFKALCLGATSTYIGRAFNYGLGAMGKAGVTTALTILQKELDITMALCGETNITEVGRHNLWRPDPLSSEPG